MNRKQSLAATATTAGLFVLLATGYARAAEHYVSPDGSDSDRGTMHEPFATLSKANSAAAAGDTIWVRGGTYYVTGQLVLSRSGTSDTNRTKIWAYPGEKPVLDASRYVTSNPAVDVPVVLVTGSWMHLRGLEIGNAKVGRSGDHSYSLLRTKGSSDNIFELLHLHHGFGPGLFIDKGNGGNLVLNCDAHDNYDQNGSQGDGQNGDGFGVHYQTTGPSTIIRGCRAWNNSDDGYDYISQEVPVITEGSFAMSNGRGSEGNGNGFKVGSSKTGVRHLVQNNVAWKNKAAGFYANHSSGGNTWLNNTAYNNGTQYNMLASPPDDSSQTIILSGALAHKMRNNIGFPNKNSNMGGVDTAFNTWDLNITEASSAFESTSDAGCTGPREADGSIPSACVFMKLKTGSDLIDRGTDVGLPFVGSAPDLGAHEFGAGPTAGTGGGAGGGSGTAGNGMGGTASSGGGDGGSGGTVGTGAGAGAAGGAGQGGDLGVDGSPETGGATGGTDGNSGGRAGAAGTSEDYSSAAGCAFAVSSDDATAGVGEFALLALASAFAARSRDRRTARREGGRQSRL
ncbi:right-handed parallel beta-helix repeat-containing protein [Sorangium cellulosum]|uniref:right-handed parallel beta-helix repeat-containing protein n=1 Tax=Sorangium cellulosum TaxID=56 RepID=UPI003D9A5288